MKDKQFIGSFDLSMIPSLEEFDKRYSHSYLKIENEEGMSDIFFYSGFTGKHCSFVNDLFGEIRLNADTTSKVQPIFPKVGLFNHKNKALFTCKVPVRQNRRSVSEKNVKFEDPLMTFYGHRREFVRIGYAILRDSIDPTYPSSVDEAIYILKSQDRTSIAFSPEYMLSWGDTDKTLSLWYKAIPIGILHEQDRLFLVDTHYAQEVKDYVRETQSNFIVGEL